MSETIASPQLFERGGSRPSELERLEVFIGKWINTGQTATSPSTVQAGPGAVRRPGARP